MTDRKALAALLLLQLALFAVVRPKGEFPLNDDWAYAHSVLWLLEEHRVRLSDWIGMNLLPQTLLGGAVAAIFGFSFEALRHLTQAVALICAGLGYAWFRTCAMPPQHAFVATCAMLAFPPWLVLANSYMSDLYGLALGLAAATLFVRCLEGWSSRLYMFAIALAAIGALQRQVALVIPFGWMVAALAYSRPWSARRIVVAILPLAVAFAAVAAYQHYLRTGPGIPAALVYGQARVLPLIRSAVLNEGGHGVWVLSNAATIAGYLGVFVAGWAAWWGGRAPGVRARLVAAAGAILALASLALEWLPPYRAHNVLDRVGIGPFMTYDAVRGLAPLDRSPGLFWSAAGVIAAVGIAILVAVLVAALFRLRAVEAPRPRVAFLLAALAGYLLPFMVTDYIDRYMLFALPFLLALWPAAVAARAPGDGRAMKAAGLAAIATALALSAAATRDYFAWNRARWAAIAQAQRMGGVPTDIDGGFEFNGFHNFQALGSKRGGRSWWFIKDDRFVVAFSAVPGYETVGRWRVKGWLPRTPREVLLLRRR